MRDLKRPNAKQPAYKFLREEGFEVFVPTKSQIITRNGKKVVEEIPVIRDLLFVHTEKERLDPIVARTETLQYRFMRNCGRAPMTVPDDEMERFIIAVSSSNDTKYYLPEEITSQMYGRKIRIVGGPLDGYEGNLITTRGSKVKRLMIKNCRTSLQQAWKSTLNTYNLYDNDYRLFSRPIRNYYLLDGQCHRCFQRMRTLHRPAHPANIAHLLPQAAVRPAR